MNLQAIRGTAAAIARQAGAELLRRYAQPHTETVKSSAVDIVTEADTAADAVIIAALRAAFPHDRLVTEESGGSGAAAAARTWYVDPLDGTINFAAGFPFFCVSLGLADSDGSPLVGVVYDPVANELFTAARGLGAALNGRPLRVSATDTLQRALVCTGFPYDRATNPDNNQDRWSAVSPRVRALRCFGAAALELCYVAAGRLDGQWEANLRPWDLTAGVLMVTEAGGTVTDFTGGAEGVRQGRVVSSNGRIHADLLAALAGRSG